MEIMDEINVVATEENATKKTGKAVVVAIGVGLTAFVGKVLYKRVLKPVIAKFKAKKEENGAEEVECETEPMMIFDEDGNPIG